MSNILLLQMDGKRPNIALMRVSAHRKRLGDRVELRRVVRPEGVERGFFDDYDLVFASLIFDRTRPVAERLLMTRPDAIIGGTGWNIYEGPDKRIPTLEDYGITTTEQETG